MMNSRDAIRVLFVLSLPVLTWPAAAAAVSSDHPAAILTFPQVVVDVANGVDTFLQLGNADRSQPVDLKCFLEDANRHCSDSGEVCADSTSCLPSGICQQDWQVDEFTLRLTAGQPFGWQASMGAATLPLAANLGSIPPVSETPFRGELRCVVVDATGAPTDRNVLQGTATVERFQAGSPPQVDAARYNPIGLQALAGANNGDNELVLGGPNAEYEGCPDTILMNTVFDFAVEPVTHSAEVITDLILVPCGGDLFTADPAAGGVVVQFFVYNEFEQHFSTSRPFTVRQDGQISLIDTNDPSRSIFSAGVASTLSGQVRIESLGGGVVGVAVERHQALGQPAGTSASAAFNLHSQGGSSNTDVLAIGPPPCGPQPSSSCRSAAKTSLVLRDHSNDARDDLEFRWRQGQATDVADFGSPATTTGYALCLYDGGDQLVASFVVAPSPKWKQLRNGHRYKDAGGSADGISRIVLRASRRDRASAQVDGEGANLPLPPLPLQVPVKAQLVNDETGACWGAVFDTSSLVANDAERFKAKTH
jgi:hypothetical protein